MKAYKTLLFIVIVLFVLGIISSLFPKEGISFGDKQLYFPTIEDILTKESGHSTTASQRMKEMEESLRIKHYNDSIAHLDFLAYQDSLSFYTTFFEEHPSRIHLPDDNWNYFDELFEDFDNCKEQNEIIHILHYGDSQIEGDRITGYVRHKLQAKFGGNGPGLLPAIQPIPSSAVGQSASGNMERYIISGSHQNRISHNRYGALGQVGMMAGESSVFVSSRNWKETFDEVKEFQKIRLFVGRPSERFNANLIVSNKDVQNRAVTNNNSSLETLTWDLDSPIKKFTLKMFGSGEIYGIAVDGQYGISMSNIPFRGSSGTFFSSIDSTLMKAMLEELNAKLIILEFGGNMMPVVKSDKVVANYKEKMSNQIAYFRALCPDIKIIMIGPADMSTKVNGRLQTYPYLEETANALKEAALENGAAFWNMYEVMGGRNSMIDWVKNSPSLAASDYIHFTVRGAERIADMFYESLMIYYDYYNFDKSSKNKEQ